MSLSNKNYATRNERYVFSSSMSPVMPKVGLPELIDRYLKAGGSFRDIQKESGGKLKLSSLNRWHKTPRANLTVESIVLLAKALHLSPTVVFEATAGTSDTIVLSDSLKNTLADFESLSARAQAELEPLIESLKQQVEKRLHRKP